MPNRTRRHVWSLCGAVVAGAALLVIGPPTRADPLDTGGGPRVVDEGHLLTGPQRAALQRSLRMKTAESGSPLSLLLVARLAPHQAIDELARRTFSDDALDAPGPPRVLLVVAAHDRRAAIETGQGAAGIVPEIDARRIVARLEAGLAHHHLVGALDEAVAALAVSARATAERRRPSPPDPLEAPAPASQVAPLDAPELAPAPKPVEAKPGTAPAPSTPDKSGRSLMPAGYALAGIVVLGLAIRRRRRLAEDRVAQNQSPGPERKGDRGVKSIGDRPMS